MAHGVRVGVCPKPCSQVADLPVHRRTCPSCQLRRAVEPEPAEHDQERRAGEQQSAPSASKTIGAGAATRHPILRPGRGGSSLPWHPYGSAPAIAAG
jgi:hypothetical protein